ncbi:PREDICTED: c-C chemokine receptor-like 2 [Elephantulus edwardii]|uniref:c-C chemokine receptor-like 2 n=1 Tax=Elephantulus edwardii TaxID=28737 RepID=UPI0003F0642B|nr:PREDICTED: c-C chemokine receptor-like 2 [Elephantulus edwardii]
MDNYTSSPVYEDYEILIWDGPKYDDSYVSNVICDKYDPAVLRTQLIPGLYFTIFVVCLLSNVLMAFILIKHKGLRHMENIYFLNLAISNLLFSLTLPFWASAASRGGPLADPMCTLLLSIYVIGLYSEVCFMLLLVAHRYLVFSPASSIPWATRPVPCGIFTSILGWTVAVLVTLPESTIYRLQKEGRENECSQSRPHLLPAEETFWKRFLTLKVNILGFLFPLFIFLFCSVRMRKVLRFRSSRDDLSKLVFAILAVFLVMWAPYLIAIFLLTFKEAFSLGDCQSRYSLDQGVQITEIIAATHCCINPLLHALFSQTCRKGLCHLLCLSHSSPVP